MLSVESTADEVGYYQLNTGIKDVLYSMLGPDLLGLTVAV